MHPFQQNIIYTLMLKSVVRYADLKPKEIEGNLFMYHLKKLIDDELVRKNEDGKYELTSKGKLYADTLSLKTLKPRLQPKIVSMLVFQNEKGEVLLYHRKRAPFTGLIGFPYGKLHLSETISEAAFREMREKVGFEIELEHRGDAYIIVYQDKELVSHMLCHIFSNKKPIVASRKVLPLNVWEKIEDPDASHFMPGLKEIYKLVIRGKKELFFEEFVFRGI